MQDQIAKLIRVQEKDMLIKALTHELIDLPKNLAGLKQEFENSGKAVQDAKKLIKSLQVDRKKRELDVEAAQEKKQKYEAQLMKVKTNQEYKSLEKEIYGIKMDVLKIENEILDIMENIETEEKFFKEKEAAYKEEEEKIRTREREIQDQIKQSEEDLKTVRSERETLVQDVDGAVLKRYEKIITRVSGKAIVPIRDRNCKGCFTTLPPQVVVDVRRGNQLTTCENCGRILVVEETAPVSSKDEDASS